VSPLRPQRLRLIEPPWLRHLVAALSSLAAVAVVSVAVFVLDSHAPVVSLGVLYLFAVLPVAAIWGLTYAIPVSVLSMLAFNWLFLPPTHTFRLADSENWVALAVYLVTAISVSGLSARARRRAEEAELGRRDAERAVAEARESEERRLRAAVEAEALRRSDAVKTAVLRSVSHDLRSPITAITTASEILDDDAGTLPAGDREELVAAILLQARRLDRLVANLLELSRLEAGAAAPQLELWPVDGLVTRALDALGTASNRVDVEIPPEAPPVEVDPAQMERALANVIDNALRFSPENARVLVRAAQNETEVLVEVVDRGPGIPAHERERVFEAFVRGDPTQADRGSGLGLAIARGFVNVNGGRIWVEPEPGAGSRFVVVLPAAALPAPARA
jgi:two-component system sensor histidine kinase KdpD